MSIVLETFSIFSKDTTLFFEIFCESSQVENKLCKKIRLLLPGLHTGKLWLEKTKWVDYCQWCPSPSGVWFVYKNIFYRKLQHFSTLFECWNLQCNSSVDLVRCIEESTYSRDEALVHASVGFDARCHHFVLSDHQDLCPGCLWWRLPCGERSSPTWSLAGVTLWRFPGGRFFIDVKEKKVFFTPSFIQDWYEWLCRPNLPLSPSPFPLPCVRPWPQVKSIIPSKSPSVIERLW